VIGMLHVCCLSLRSLLGRSGCQCSVADSRFVCSPGITSCCSLGPGDKGFQLKNGLVGHSRCLLYMRSEALWICESFVLDVG